MPEVKHAKPAKPPMSFSKDDTASAIKIQSAWRGKLQRDKFRARLEDHHLARQARFDAADLFDAAMVIQRLVRRIRAKRIARQQLELKRGSTLNKPISPKKSKAATAISAAASPLNALGSSNGVSTSSPHRAAGSAFAYINEKRSPLGSSPKGSHSPNDKYNEVLVNVPDRLLRLSHPPQDEELLRLFQALEEAQNASNLSAAAGFVSEKACREVYHRFGGEVMLLKGETIESSVRGMLEKIIRPTAGTVISDKHEIELNFDQFCRYMLKVVPQ